jgi:hypothetical protein
MSRYVICARIGFYLTADNTVSLEIGKRYEVVDPQPRPELGLIRIIDESEEAYLYPAWWFEPEVTE